MITTGEDKWDESVSSLPPPQPGEVTPAGIDHAGAVHVDRAITAVHQVGRYFLHSRSQRRSRRPRAAKTRGGLIDERTGLWARGLVGLWSESHRADDCASCRQNRKIGATWLWIASQNQTVTQACDVLRHSSVKFYFNARCLHRKRVCTRLCVWYEVAGIGSVCSEHFQSHASDRISCLVTGNNTRAAFNSWWETTRSGFQWEGMIYAFHTS